MDAEGGGNILFIILTAQGEQHAFAPALRHELLKRAARRIEHHAFGTILAADAGPQGIVAIERDRFERRCNDGVDLACQGGGQGHEIQRRVGQASEFVAVRIEYIRHRVEGGDLGGGEHVDGGQSSHTATYHIVEL